MTDSTPPQQGIPGWYIEFQAAILQLIPRPPQMDKVTAMRLSKNPREFKQILARLLNPEVKQIELSDKRFHILETFDLFVPEDFESTIVRPGQKLKVDFLMTSASILDCINFLTYESALPLGKEGSLLVLREYSRVSEKGMRIPLCDRWIASFGMENILEVPGVLGENYTNYRLQSKSIKEIEQDGGVLFLFCFLDASN